MGCSKMVYFGCKIKVTPLLSISTFGEVPCNTRVVYTNVFYTRVSYMLGLKLCMSDVLMPPANTCRVYGPV